VHSIDAVREALCDMLWDIPHMRQEETRNAFVAELRRRVHGLSVPTGITDKFFCIALLDAALQERGALQEMARILSWLEDGSGPAERFSSYVEELLPTESLTLTARISFITALSPLVARDELASYFRTITHDVPSHGFASLEELARALEELAHGPCHPLILLSEAISHRARTPLEAKRAGRWSEQLARMIGPDEVDSLARFRASGEMLVPPEFGRSTIVLKLDESGVRQDRYLFSAWLYIDNTLVDKMRESDRAIPLDQVRPILSQLIDEVIVRVQERGDATPEIALEFILPRSLLSYPFEAWQNRDPAYMTLGVQFILVVRDLERVRDPLLRAACSKKWKHIIGEGDRPAADLSVWVTCSDCHITPDQTFYQMKPDSCGSLGLTFQPGDGSHTFDLEGALNAGMPIIIWPRRCDHAATPIAAGTADGFRDTLSQRLKIHRLRDLPSVVLEMRLDEARSGTQGWGVALFWYDPTRTPEPPNYRMAVPVALEETL
jgi:hypothetical protein